ncbi:MAG: DUF5812 family protein [Salinarchaeum sp.]
MATETRGTFLVTEAEVETAVLQDVETAQVYSLATNPGFSVDEVVEATLAPVPPMDVLWSVETVMSTHTIEVAEEERPPTDRARELATECDPGEVVRRSLNTEELHVLSVPASKTDQATADICADAATLRRAARLGAETVTVRSADGVVSVRYQALSA